VRARSSWRAEPKPILFNEDSTNLANFDAAVAKGASWGYHDKGGYQMPPVNWGINTSAKRAFFDRVAHYASTSTAPAISFSPASLTVSAPEGGAVVSRSVSLQTNDGGTPQYTVTSDAAWLTVSPAGGTAPATLTVSANPAGLAPGTYTGALTASATGYGTARLSVTMTVTGPSLYDLLVSTRADRGGAVPLEGQVVSGGIRVFTGPDDGVDEVTFWIDDPDRSGGAYQREGNGPFDLAGGSVSTANAYDTTDLNDGPHTITASLRLLNGTTEVIHASFTVRNNAPPPPALGFTPSSLTLSATEGDPAIARDVTLAASNATAASYTLSSSAAWLSATPGTGSTPATLSVVANPTGLAPGTYSGTVTATAAGYNPATLSVSLTVAAEEPPPGEDPPYALMVSTRADRGGAVPLAGQVVSGDIRVFTAPDTGVDEVTFWIDDPDRSDAAYRREGNGPFDLAGGSVATADPYDTGDLNDGPHTVTAALKLLNGTTEVIHAAFTVRNNAPPPPGLAFTPSSLTLSATEGDPAIARDVTLAASDATAASYTVSSNAAWLSATPAAGSTAATLSVVANPTGLAPGTYSGNVTATAPGYNPATLSVSLTVAAEEPPPGEDPPYSIVMSTRSDRAGAVPLDGRTVSGNIYVFTAPDTGVDEVTFYIDDPNRTRAPYRREGNGPFDLAGGDVAVAKPYRTTSLADGRHTVTAVLDLTAGGSEVVHATFTVNN
jgi:Viral BACON domain